MYTISTTKKFEKDVKLAVKRQLDTDLLKEIIEKLESEGEVSQKHKPHKLKGNYDGLWECHIKPDWLLIWDKNEAIKLISLIRTGSHSDLF
ncbi:MAG: type II toxin-antitoxin system YafQ family toxin [Bacteroidales bacterium]|nr:type II toxin-antitoxin system YafQ family toxin [Bacteroidales bacterium]